MAGRLFHLPADLFAGLLPGCFPCLFSCLLAHPRGRFGRRLLDLAADAVGLGDDAPFGLAGRVREPSLEPSLPFLAQGVDFLTMPFGGLVRGPRQGVDLEPGLVRGLARLLCRVLRLLRFESGPLGLGGHPALGVGGGIGQPRLQAAAPLVAHGIDFRRPHLGGLRFRLAPRVFALLGEPIDHLGGLGVEIGLQPRTECVDRRTKIVIGHLRHYRDGAWASQASTSSCRAVQTQPPQ